MYGAELHGIGDIYDVPIHGGFRLSGIFVHAMALDNLLETGGNVHFVNKAKGWFYYLLSALIADRTVCPGKACLFRVLASGRTATAQFAKMDQTATARTANLDQAVPQVGTTSRGKAMLPAEVVPRDGDARQAAVPELALRVARRGIRVLDVRCHCRGCGAGSFRLGGVSDSVPARVVAVWNSQLDGHSSCFRTSFRVGQDAVCRSRFRHLSRSVSNLPSVHVQAENRRYGPTKVNRSW